ncbi:virus tail fibre assembly protein, lambda gpK [Pseudomonas guariconensis]|uniref:tail fiber assembly protein n=1 Tax=Pseudomonas guariconensis TaxID=1288410 RepID=UPI000886F3DE|nr:tail fiber assembly protein [Pseudomonas guariconensis]SDE14818.1 virus tail fibre assembly protein, lambda gpK [Pseudomonas guariconensis]
MPYAANGEVRRDFAEGFVEITEAQYLEAIDGMCEGLVVTIDGGFKVAPPPEPEPEPEPEKTPEEIEAQVKAQRDGLLSFATLRIAPLQDAADLGEATAAEEAALMAWKRYRLALNRVETQEGYPETVDWPVPPA